ncbi:MAG: ATP-binding cassette domain-containing protein [Anaerofustis stercorihominis]|nr:ATP-binding cassette domain-containing protein [Anaerofustis stercorihominis]
MAHFDIKDLNFSYVTTPDKLTLNNINLTIGKGQYITLCGKSGCGKTTLLKHLKSVLAPHGNISGEIYFDGKLLSETDHRTQSSQIGYVMQNPDNQVVTDKVWHELAFGLESLGYDQKTIRLRVAEMASYFGIQTWFHKNVSDLSGGQKQLLNLASIMAMQPTVLILDEPTSQLDPIAASDFLNTVRKINLELGTTVIITEHRLEDVFHASDRVVVMDKGRIIADDTPRNVGELLKKENSDMFAAMPSPVQIYYGVDSTLMCPLTVREGRNWLSEHFDGKRVEYTKVEEEAPLDEDDNNNALELKEVWFRYEKDSPDILKGVSFKVKKESVFAIVGGNGTGKSTTLKAICNICKPYRGKVLINGTPLKKFKAGELFRENLAMLPQDPQSLFVKKTVREDLQEMLRKNDPAMEEKILEVAGICEITDLLDSHPYDLSGGEQQRAALAKVLLTNPKILLLDEPTKGLDNFFKLKFAEILDRLKKNGVTVVMVSHDVEFCAKYADTVSMFFDGSIITTNTPNRFFSQNSFYTTAANRMSRHIFENAVTNEDVINLINENLKNKE